MKKIFFLIVLLAGVSFKSIAQKFAYIDSQYILENVPEYKTAQAELDKLSAKWQKEVEERYATIDRMYKSFQAEKVLLTDEMKQSREDEIVKKEKEAKDLQKQRFGVEGDLFKKRQELIQPIQENIYKAVKEMADEGGFTMVFDKGNQSNIMYSDPKFDKSDKVIRKMGYKPGENSTSEESGEEKEGEKESTDPKMTSPKSPQNNSPQKSTTREPK
jgi:outer membrane protein